MTTEDEIRKSMRLPSKTPESDPSQDGGSLTKRMTALDLAAREQRQHQAEDEEIAQIREFMHGPALFKPSRNQTDEDSLRERMHLLRKDRE